MLRLQSQGLDEVTRVATAPRLGETVDAVAALGHWITLTKACAVSSGPACGNVTRACGMLVAMRPKDLGSISQLSALIASHAWRDSARVPWPARVFANVPRRG